MRIRGAAEGDSTSSRGDYRVSVSIREYEPGDVVYFPAGPFHGICAVVQEVDDHRAQLHLSFREGVAHREGTVLRERRHNLTVGFDEIELL
jgi:hypothetical protein